jgi:mRNA-degrading endonuclease RelE of RelBE toxin-antitoxin system
MVFALEFVEASGSSAIRDKYFSGAEFHLLQLFLMANPDAGSVIRGSGGVRKLRWGVKGSGKRGGLRVIYYRIASDNKIFLITVYRKTEVSDLSRTSIKEIRKLMRDYNDKQAQRGGKFAQKRYRRRNHCRSARDP